MKQEFSLFTDYDIHLFRAGRHFKIHEKLGSHLVTLPNGEKGAYFAVWAPEAQKVSVIGGFNLWNTAIAPMTCRWDGSGIWEVFVPNVGHGEQYKYEIKTKKGYKLQKSDPYARRWETPPNTATFVWQPEKEYVWGDAEHLKSRKANEGKNAPFSVYEIHLGSWKRLPAEQNRSLTYREMAAELPKYMVDMGFTHVELLPIYEHPYEPSWGYQGLGYFAPTNRFGTPEDFKFLVDSLHQVGVGVILDWVPSHFPMDAHGLYEFDGTHLYEDRNPQRGYHNDWKSAIFDYGKGEVKSFLISNALFWLEHFHIDGLRVDAVASMVYLDYSRKEGEWQPNVYGGRENLESIAFLKEFNDAVKAHFPDCVTIAEESTAFPRVSHPTSEGGLGFSQKWMMGWMHDSLNYFKRLPQHRPWHQSDLLFSIHYAFSERFMLPLSHDEVVHLKASILGKMPGDEWQRFANLRTLYGYMFTHPGTRLLFMGAEFGQSWEWNHEAEIGWALLQSKMHKGIQNLVRELNRLNKNFPAMYEQQFSPEGFAWIAGGDTQNCVASYIRKGKNKNEQLVVVLHFGLSVIPNYEIGVPLAGTWKEVINSDADYYGGSNVTNNGDLKTIKKDLHHQQQALSLTIPPLGFMVLQCTKPTPERKKTGRKK